MKYFLIFVLLSGLQLFGGPDMLWFDTPAEEWTEGLPLGNGRLMAMYQGGIDQDQLQFNEDTLWTGQPTPRDRPGGAQYLSKVRELMFAGEYWEAERLVEQRMLGLRLDFGMHTYQTLGDLNFRYKFGESSEKASDFRRELDLENAVAAVGFEMGDTVYKREVFVSPVDNCVVMRITSNKPGRISFDAQYSRPKVKVETVDDNVLVISGVAEGQAAGWRGVEYVGRIHFEVENGSVGAIKNGIRIENADEVIIRVVAATDYRGTDPYVSSLRQLEGVVAKPFSDLKRSHVVEHQRLYKRVNLQLGNHPNLPLDKRLAAFSQGADDPALIGLYFQFGRYLLISSSRPGSMAVNLWGKWVNSIDPAYNADYHININIQMNYWLAEVGNLAECHIPLFDLTDNLRPRGRITARETYGAGGFTAHHATDAWWFTSAIGRPPYGMWPMAPAWNCNHLWNHFLYNGDMEFLEDRAYPIMKEAAEFFLGYLVEHPHTGYMVTGPSTSPENRFITDDGKVVSLSMAPTMDMQLVNDLFSNCITASKLLDRDDKFREKLIKLRSKLMPMQIGDDGRLLEWEKPFHEHNKGHRHISHLWGLCPGDQITENTPELFEAAGKSLDTRVLHGAADSPEYQGIAAWILCCYTRLLDGEKAYGILSHILSNSSWSNLFAVGERGRLRKMFETDVNFGATSAIAEMLLQSHAGYINLLPALPAALPDGKITGLRARNGFEVDIEWRNGELKFVEITSLLGKPCMLKYQGQVIEFPTDKGDSYRFNASLESK
ncbi:MAG: glycoside hydrolase N-terminal domain-containing protein [Puniceicoccaceae bacterium]